MWPRPDCVAASVKLAAYPVRVCFLFEWLSYVIVKDRTFVHVDMPRIARCHGSLCGLITYASTT